MAAAYFCKLLYTHHNSPHNHDISYSKATFLYQDMISMPPFVMPLYKLFRGRKRETPLVFIVTLLLLLLFPTFALFVRVIAFYGGPIIY